MRLPIAIISEEIIAAYNLLPLVKNGFVYILIQKGIYGLPQAGKLANDEFIKHLAPFGYQPTTHTPGLLTHKNRNISFVLTIDDFGIKYTKMRDATHLFNALRTSMNCQRTGQDRYTVVSLLNGIILKILYNYLCLGTLLQCYKNIITLHLTHLNTLHIFTPKLHMV